MTKDKKKKKKKDKKSKGGQSTGGLSPKVTKRLQEISRNPLVADIVAATLVSAAAALRDSKKAQQLAAKAGDELEDMATRGARSGNVLWQLALDVGRKSLESLAGDNGGKRARKSKPASTSKAVSKPMGKKADAASKRRKSAASPAKRQAPKPAAR